MEYAFDYWVDLQAVNQFDTDEVVVVALRKIVEVIEGRPVKVFDVHVNQSLSPVVAWSILNTLKEKGLLIEEHGYYRANLEKFEVWLHKNRKAIFSDARLDLRHAFSFLSELDDDPLDISRDLIDSFPPPAT